MRDLETAELFLRIAQTKNFELENFVINKVELFLLKQSYGLSLS